MHPDKVSRCRLETLCDLPNIGPASAADLRQLGIDTPADLHDRCPLEMYRQLCTMTGKVQDPCVLDVFLSITDFIAGGQAKRWWAYTAERKRLLNQRLTEKVEPCDGNSCCCCANQE
ncbi:MAG TPA: helix-hairpin-helix domain-containing protein [Accumulibacter sp.]|nr:helix-hairpin-helix domain-containing protein [Accumulibacter sp.]